MYISFAKVLKPMQKDNNKKFARQLEVSEGMKCPECNVEMKIDKECGYMKQYRCYVCGRVETLWTVCVTA